jgi:hypothetical protein
MINPQTTPFKRATARLEIKDLFPPESEPKISSYEYGILLRISNYSKKDAIEVKAYFFQSLFLRSTEAS